MSLMGRLKDDSGVSAVIVAVFITVAVGMAAVVVDVGYLYDTRRQLQAAADAAALAGCQELIMSADAGNAETAARDYADRNAVGPAAGLTVASVSVDMDEWSVRVGVSKDSPAFFSRIFGDASHQVAAAAKAKRWRLSGARYLVPWAIPILREVDRVEALVVNGKDVISSTDLSASGLDYTGSLAAPGSSGGYDVLLRIWNQYGVPEYMIDSSNNKETAVGRIVVPDGDHPFTSVSLSEDFIASDDFSYPVLTVRTVEPQAKVWVKLDKVKHSMTDAGGGTLWTYTIQPGDVDDGDDLLRTYECNVYVGSKADKLIDAYLHVRRSTHPVGVVAVSPTVSAAGGTVFVQVTLNEFDPTTAVPGQTYTLRVGSDSGENGNYCELNYNKIVHSGDCPDDPGGIKPGNNYYDWTAYGYPGGIHVGDLIDTSPGVSGANTEKALDERLANLQPGEDMVIVAPVVEKYEDKGGGAYQVIVDGFAAFRITRYEKDATVEGEFIEYVANPSEYTADPGSGGGAYAPRLVNP